MEEEARESSNSPELKPEPALATNRTRRSAAVSSNRAWAALLPGKKGLDVSDGEDQDKTANAKGTGYQGRKRGRPRKPSAYAGSPDEKSPPPHLNAQIQQSNADDDGQVAVRHPVQQNQPQRQQPPSLKPQSQLRTNYAAPTSEQLAQIEREVQKHQYSTEGRSGDEEDYDDEEERYNLDEDSDDEYMEASSRATRRSTRGRQATRTATIAQAPGQRPVQAAGGGPPPRAPGFTGFRPAQAPPPTLGQPRRIVVNGHGPVTTVYSNHPPTVALRRAHEPSGPGAYKVLRITRPGGQPPAAPSGFRTIPAPQQPQPSAAHVNQEIQEIAAHHAQHLIEGSRIQDFNDIIDNINHELNRVIDDRNQLLTGHREYIEQMNLSHATALDIKDNRIRQLEQTVADLQNKLSTAYKRQQLDVLRQETGRGGGVEGGRRLMSESSNAGEGDGYHTMQKMAIESPNKILRADPMMSRQPVDNRYHQVVQHNQPIEYMEQEFVEGELEIGHEIAL